MYMYMNSIAMATKCSLFFIDSKNTLKWSLLKPRVSVVYSLRGVVDHAYMGSNNLDSL